ncbi:unnamed protein product [Aspergillus oryzae RIB40]|uniref:DNA, SC003 n=1 Tax=Aspergillus oryzae (strain ATCC 42149 / RIB 40) TaxID=510516 RepID=Q2UJ11_ASPOR|nr:unnamed protein product [Aspergillus oryzae RIB40]BAE58454.1 unnamed protein product [Aspergillus oryzae RIB40]
MDGTKDSGTDHVEQYVENPKDQDLRSVPTALLDWSPEERRQREKALVRKIDTRLLIIMLVMYILNYLDRNNIAAAKSAGLQDDLNLKGEEYQVCVSILFVGYLLMQVPSNMILNRSGKPSIYLPGCMVVWGIISCLTAVTKDFGGLLAVRFSLGFVEAAYFPGCLYFLSAWYTRKELVERTALLYVGSLISGAFSGLISAGITSGLNGARGIAAWRWLFIIEGSLTTFVALLACFIVPDLPRTTSWLSNDEKVLAAWRLEEDIGEDDWVDSEHQSMFHGAKLAIFLATAWRYLRLYIIRCRNHFFSKVRDPLLKNFIALCMDIEISSSVMAGLGKDNIDTLLLTTPPCLIGTIIVLIHAWDADGTGERYLHLCLPPTFAIASFILYMAGNNFAARYVAMSIMPGSIYASYVVALGYISNSNVLPRPAAKRAAALAFINAVSNVAQIYTPYHYPGRVPS